MAQSRSRSRTPPRSSRKRRSSPCRSSRHRSRKHGISSRRRRRHRSHSSHSCASSRRSASSLRCSPTPERSRPVDPPASTCLGVFGLSNYTRETDLMNIFCTYGTIDKAMIVYDAKTKFSRGFGFVYFREQDAASAAKVQCNGMVVHERTIRVDYSVSERPHTPTPGVYMGERDGDRRRNRSSYSYRGRSYDDDLDDTRYRRSFSRSRDRRRRSSRHRRYRCRSVTRSRSRSGSYASRSSSRRSYRYSR